jgi:uncharacterized protein (DUF2225 family)
MIKVARVGCFVLALLLLSANQNKSRGSNVESDIESASCSVEASWITWFPKEVECPICKTKNIFMVWGSYGSYIYQDPSKYQLIFWPYTDTPTVYSCKKCRLTVFMDDFEKIPTEKIPELRKVLETISLPAQPDRSEKDSLEHPPYLEIRTSDRIAAAEKVYRALGKNDDEFWNHFYRVLAYHYDRHEKHDEADKARKQSIAITEKQLAGKTNEGERKELLYLLGAMRHFTRDDEGALKAFAEAEKVQFHRSDLTAEQNNNYNTNLSLLIKEYTELIKKGEGPRLKRQ